MNSVRKFLNNEDGLQRLEVAVIAVIVIIVIAIIYASAGRWQRNTLM